MTRIPRVLIVVAVVGLAVGLTGCQSFGVRTDWDPGAPFDEMQRYFWVEPPETEGANPFADNTLLRKRLRFGVEAELETRGFQSTQTRDEADFLVTYSIILEERLKVDGYSSSAGVYRSRYYGFGTIHSTASIRNYQESTLIIDFLNSANDDLVWRGWGTGIVRTRDRDRDQERLAKGIAAILQKYPPSPPRESP
jgi:hypothetical protein